MVRSDRRSIELTRSSKQGMLPTFPQKHSTNQGSLGKSLRTGSSPLVARCCNVWFRHSSSWCHLRQLRCHHGLRNIKPAYSQKHLNPNFKLTNFDFHTILSFFKPCHNHQPKRRNAPQREIYRSQASRWGERRDSPKWQRRKARTMVSTQGDFFRPLYIQLWMNTNHGRLN